MRTYPVRDGTPSFDDSIFIARRPSVPLRVLDAATIITPSRGRDEAATVARVRSINESHQIIITCVASTLAQSVFIRFSTKLPLSSTRAASSPPRVKCGSRNGYPRDGGYITAAGSCADAYLKSRSVLCSRDVHLRASCPERRSFGRGSCSPTGS